MSFNFKDVVLVKMSIVLLMDLFFLLGFYESCAGIPAHHISSFDGPPLSSADPSECFI